MDISPALSQLKAYPHIEEAVVLSTCNRVEIIVITDNTAGALENVQLFLSRFHQLDPNTLFPYLYHFSNEKAVDHLFRVACGLDSLVFGEAEILGQVKEAFNLALAEETIGLHLFKLKEKTLEVAKKLRSNTDICKGATSVASASVELAHKIFGQLKGEQILVLGTGEMGVQSLKYLSEGGAGHVYVTSRREEKAVQLAKEFHAEVVNYSDWEKSLEKVDIVLCSTSAPRCIVSENVVKQAMSRRHHKPMFIIDISVPRNVEPKVNELDDVYLYNIDDLKVVCESNMKVRQAEWPKCLEIISQGVTQYMNWQKSLSIGPIVQKMQAYFDGILDQEIEQMINKLNMNEEQLTLLKHRIKGKLLHKPMQVLNEAARSGGLQVYLEALNKLFGLEEMESVSHEDESSQTLQKKS